MNIIIKMLAAFTMLVTMIGCDSTKPSADNYEKGLNHFFARQQSCSNYVASDFPRMVPAEAGRGDKLLDALAANGLVNRAETASSTGESQITYTLTGKGSKTQFAAENPINQQLSMFCFGTKRVDTITNFEMPDPNHNVRVFYTWAVKDVPDWAKDPAVQAAWPSVADLFRADPTGVRHKAQDTLRQTANGWRVAQDE